MLASGETPATGCRIAIQANRSRATNPKARILIIDYEPRSIQELRGPLETAGFQIEVAKDGLLGIETFQRWQPDLTLIEAMLPKRHGFEVCQELKKTPHGTKTPIVIVTSVYKGRKYRTQAFHNYGCDEYIEKPIDGEKLLDTVRQLLAGHAVAVDFDLGPDCVEEEEEDARDDAAQTAAPASEDPAEDEIISRLDSLLSLSPVPAGNGSLAVTPKVAAAPEVVRAAPEEDRLNPDAAKPRAATPRSHQPIRTPSTPRPGTGLRQARASTQQEPTAVSEGFLKWLGFTVLGLVIAILAVIVVVS